MRLFLAPAFLILVGCAAPSSEGSGQIVPEPKWEGLTVTWNNRKVVLDTIRDSLFFLESVQDAADPFAGKHQSVFAGQDVRDSIWMIARRLMDRPTIREMELTDYAGDYIRVKFSAGVGTMQSLEYRSQRGWPAEGDLGLLRRLTFDRFPSE